MKSSCDYSTDYAYFSAYDTSTTTASPYDSTATVPVIVSGFDWNNFPRIGKLGKLRKPLFEIGEAEFYIAEEELEDGLGKTIKKGEGYILIGQARIHINNLSKDLQNKIFTKLIELEEG